MGMPYCEMKWESDGYLARVVLQHSREEALREVEARDPEDRGGSFVNPLLHEAQPAHEVVNPGAKRLYRGVGYLVPQLGHFVIKYALVDLVKVVAHYDKSVDSLVQIEQTLLHDLQELLEPKDSTNSCTYLINSCCSTVLSDSSLLTGNLRPAASRSKSCGSWSRMFLMLFFVICSGVSWPFPTSKI